MTSPETRATVDGLLKAHPDFMKLHNGMTAAIYDAIAKEAHAVGLPFDGHLPKAGPLTLEHGKHMLLSSQSPHTSTSVKQKARLAKEGLENVMPQG